MRQKRDYAMLALLFGCGLRRSELVGLEMSDVQTRQGHWAIVDLVGNAFTGGRTREMKALQQNLTKLEVCGASCD